MSGAERMHAWGGTGATIAVLTLLLLTGCPRHQPPQASPSPVERTGGHGPFFPVCGGLSDQAVAQRTGAADLVETGKNSAGCQWLGAGYRWPRIVFAWYRGSPLERERRVAELMGKDVDDLTIDGNPGFVAVTEGSADIICEVAIRFGRDFIEWSVSSHQIPAPAACGIAEDLARQSITNAK